MVSFGLTSLFARLNPFIPIVHKDKNHTGESTFAAHIFQKLQLNHEVYLSKFRSKRKICRLYKMPTHSGARLRFMALSTMFFRKSKRLYKGHSISLRINISHSMARRYAICCFDRNLRQPSWTHWSTALTK